MKANNDSLNNQLLRYCGIVRSNTILREMRTAERVNSVKKKGKAY